MASSASASKLPAGLMGVLNRPDEQRDSAYFSAKDPASKHNSTLSSNGLHSIDQITRADTVSITDTMPSPKFSISRIPSLNSPTSGTMSVASIVSPIYQGFSQTLHDAGSHNSGVSTNSTVSALSNNDDLRRESVDSRLGVNFGDMRLANSPSASANQSTTSLQSNLAQQRNPSSVLQDRNSVPYLISNGRLPKYPRLADTESMISSSRTAPLITGPAKGAIARASEPTKGQAWAFPEEPIHRKSSLPRFSEESHSRPPNKSFNGSHRGSLAESIASSRYTADSSLPRGQLRLGDGIPPDSIQELQSETDSQNNSQPYSRTPELRVSHKLAERKRRLEMKDLFDSLRTLQSVERGAKASKWEILSKAISEHERQAKLIEEQKMIINRMESQLQRIEIELQDARRDSNTMRDENARLRSEVSSFQNSCNRQYHSAVSHSHSYNGPVVEQQAQLPPLRSIHVPEVMNGVQYHLEQRPENSSNESRLTLTYNQR